MNYVRYGFIDSQHNPSVKDETFSGYKKTHVTKQLSDSIIKGKLDKACFWMAELDISGYSLFIWKKAIMIACKEINTASPNLPFYLYKKSKEYEKILENKDVRNIQSSRDLLCEMISVLTLSPKRKFPSTKTIKEDDLTLNKIKKK